jgi:hypothetical protein
VIRAGNPRQNVLEMVESRLKLVMVHVFPDCTVRADRLCGVTAVSN